MLNTSKRSGVVGEEDTLYSQVMIFDEEETEDDPDKKKVEKGLGEDDEDLEDLDDLKDEEEEEEESDSDGAY